MKFRKSTVITTNNSTSISSNISTSISTKVITKYTKVYNVPVLVLKY